MLPNRKLCWLYVLAGVKGVLKLSEFPFRFLLCTFDCNPLLMAFASYWVPPHVEDDAPASLRSLGIWPLRWTLLLVGRIAGGGADILADLRYTTSTRLGLVIPSDRRFYPFAGLHQGAG